MSTPLGAQAAPDGYASQAKTLLLQQVGRPRRRAVNRKVGERLIAAQLHVNWVKAALDECLGCGSVKAHYSLA